MTDASAASEIAEALVHLRHFRLLTPAMQRQLAPTDRRSHQAGLVGRRE